MSLILQNNLEFGSLGGGGGSGAVDSVNGKTGTVVLTGSDLVTETDITGSTASITLASDTIYNCGEMTSITLSIPNDLTPKFIAQLNFTSGSTATDVDGSSITWLGDDVDTTFTAQSDKRYSIMFFYDGINVRGIVQAVDHTEL